LPRRLHRMPRRSPERVRRARDPRGRSLLRTPAGHTSRRAIAPRRHHERHARTQVLDDAPLVGRISRSSKRYERGTSGYAPSNDRGRYRMRRISDARVTFACRLAAVMRTSFR
jgi:hypothetical protein